MAKGIYSDRDINIARYILDVLCHQINVFMSWGADPKTMKPVKCGLQFHVQGFKHTGLVRIQLNEGADLFDVTLISEEGEEVRKIEGVFFGELISTVDEAVEKTDNYDKTLCDTYPFLKDPDNPEKVRPIEIVIL